MDLDAEVPATAALQRAIERLRLGAPHLTSTERRKLASLRMNLRILEDLNSGAAPSDPPSGKRELEDGEDTNRA